MARQVEFNRDAVLERSMQVFWTTGYRDTSMAQLTQATGLKPGSIYNSFESKKGLFLATIEFYNANAVAPRLKLLRSADAPLDRVEKFFTTAYRNSRPDQLIGCLLTNTATEIGAVDNDIAECVAAGLTSIEGALAQCCREARQQGELRAGLEPDEAATHLLAAYQGLAVIGRLTRDKSRLDTISQQAVASIRTAVSTLGRTD